MHASKVSARQFSRPLSWRSCLPLGRSFQASLAIPVRSRREAVPEKTTVISNRGRDLLGQWKDLAETRCNTGSERSHQQLHCRESTITGRQTAVPRGPLHSDDYTTPPYRY